MDDKIHKGVINPRLKANPISKLFFGWLIPIFWQGRKQDLEPEDLHAVLPWDKSDLAGADLQRQWEIELQESAKRNTKPSLQKAIRRTYFKEFMYNGLYAAILTIMVKMLQPIALGFLIRHFSTTTERDDPDSIVKAYYFATGVIAMTLFESIIFCHVTWRLRELGYKLRVASSAMIYKKVLKLSSESASQAGGGTVINLLTNDVVRFEQMFVFLHYFWLMPLQGLTVCYYLWTEIGTPALPGVLFMVFQTVPFQVYWGKKIHSLRKIITERVDLRVLHMNEIISGIRVIKMYTWEKVFSKMVSEARRRELKVIAFTNYMKGATWASFSYAQRSALCVTILCYVLMSGRTIRADMVFSIAQYFSTLTLTMAGLFPRGLNYYAEAVVTIKRVQTFLLMEESGSKGVVPCRDEDNALELDKVSASWSNKSQTDKEIKQMVVELDLEVPQGELIGVVGNVGTGKSTLLKIILNELKPSSGEVRLGGTVSYAAQEPWLFNDTVLSNILFGEPYDEKRYQQVVSACCLEEDFKQLPHGHLTLVGEKGSGLSGGQCARVNLARAVYREADIYLLDDPLAAVDPAVARSLFDRCVLRLLRDKTRLLVTHQTQFLRDVDRILQFEAGRVAFDGAPDDSALEMAERIRQNSIGEGSKELIELIRKMSICEVKSEDGKSVVDDDDDDAELNIEEHTKQQQSAAETQVGEGDGEDEPQETQEFVAKGSVSNSLYWKYFKANGSICMLICLALMYVVAQLFSSGADYWVAYWVKHEAEVEKYYNLTLAVNTTLPPSSSKPESSSWHLYLYTILVMGSVSLTIGRNMLLFRICKDSSFRIHEMMLGCLMRAPISFFDRNPSGRIINRFSKDLSAVDETLTQAMMESFQVLSILIGVAVQVLVINWTLILPMTVMICIHLYLRFVYLATARSVKRLEGNAKSPVFSHANSTLRGLLTIRACQAERMVTKQFDDHQDYHTAAFSLVLSTMSAFGFWIDLVSVAFVAVVTYSFVILNDSDGGKVGLAITQVLAITGVLQHGMKMAAEMVSQMISVERLFQFTKLDEEGPYETPNTELVPKDWPSRGEVRFEKLYLTYQGSQDPVLKDLNIVIESGMKVGIVGRTGAGKSSLIAALFRLTATRGKLYIDGVDTASIGLRALRRKLSIIPQQPMLYTASLRDNLDPEHKFEDSELWSALRDVELNKSFTSLDQQIEQSGNNLSAGEKQLLCLARAIVEKNKILVLDEATANVDPETDKMIQRAIRSNFKNNTVLTIAHRLNTIMDSDRVLVMEFGCAVEYGHPYLLLTEMENGYFSDMVRETGDEMAHKLRRVAEKAYKGEPLEGEEIDAGKDKDV
ncbi:multidrug resistance-associated protein 4-like [Trichogramma pretiosum]|uniref:multidrug resistance-associated protein 4-like n=1 Tax=Trichogramma pretiosum TaxID=7493 RepID=UPI0006C97EFC|nr:multidrug resistance-associated protein 4-like [Trichogramma pretiosum]